MPGHAPPSSHTLRADSDPEPRDAPPTGSEGPLHGQHLVVVGSSSGIGAAVVQAGLNAGVQQVHGLARRTITQASSPSTEDHRFVPHALDITDRGAVRAVVDELLDAGPVHCLVITAGTNVPNRSFEDLTEKDWDDLVAVNLNGAFYLVKALLPELRRRHGHVVLVSSVSATWPDLSGAAYQASKAGMLAMGRALSHDEHRNGLRVTTILPGAVDTPLLDRRPEPPPRELRDLMMQPQDVADAAVWALCMPGRTTVSEITLLPSALQSVGHSNGVLTTARG